MINKAERKNGPSRSAFFCTRLFQWYNGRTIHREDQKETRGDQKHHCQVLWAKNKYLVLSHSSNIYKEIREYLKQDQVEVSHVEDLIQQALDLPENRGQVSNAFQHIWGYFKKQATAEEKADFMLLLEKYQHGQAQQEDLIKGIQTLLERYPNRYLQDSTLLGGQ